MRIVICSMPVVALVVIASSLTIQRFEPKNPTGNIPPSPEAAALFNKMRYGKKATRGAKQNIGAHRKGPAPICY